MTDAVREAYDARAEEYADLFLDDLGRLPFDRQWLGALAPERLGNVFRE